MGNKIDKIKELQNEYNYLEFSGNFPGLAKLKKKHSNFAKHRGLPYLIPKYPFLFVEHKKIKQIDPVEMANLIIEGYLLPEYAPLKKHSYYYFTFHKPACDICGEYPSKLYMSSRKPVSEINLCEKCRHCGSPLKQILNQEYEREILEKLVLVLIENYDVPLIDFKTLDISVPINKFEEFARIKECDLENELPEEYLSTAHFRGSERRYIRLRHTPEFKDFIKMNPNPRKHEIISFCDIF